MLTVIDGFADGPEVANALDAWPSAGWGGWYTYESGKRVSRADVQAIPWRIANLLHRIATHSPPFLPDLSLWGAGLHEFPVGGSLGWHKDAEREPRMGLKRERSAILYLCGDGNLEFRDGTQVAPVPGRLVVFDGSNEHRVAAVSQPRRLLSMFYYGAPTGTGATRADFSGGVR